MEFTCDALTHWVEDNPSLPSCVIESTVQLRYALQDTTRRVAFCRQRVTLARIAIAFFLVGGGANPDAFKRLFRRNVLRGL